MFKFHQKMWRKHWFPSLPFQSLFLLFYLWTPFFFFFKKILLIFPLGTNRNTNQLIIIIPSFFFKLKFSISLPPFFFRKLENKDCLSLDRSLSQGSLEMTQDEFQCDCQRFCHHLRRTKSEEMLVLVKTLFYLLKILKLFFLFFFLKKKIDIIFII